MEASAVHQEDKKQHKLVEVTLITIDDENGDQVEEKKLVEKGKVDLAAQRSVDNNLLHVYHSRSASLRRTSCWGNK